MKKLFLCAFAVFAFASVSAQNFNAGVNVGLPVGDFGDFYSFNIQVDLAYLWEVSEEFDAGLTTGYSHSILKSEFDGDSFGAIPIAVAGRYAVSDEFTLGADLGYALSTNDGVDGGFYYRPRVSYAVSESLDVVLAYSGISLDGASFNAITAGVQFGL